MTVVRVLLVEDELVTRITLAQALRDQGLLVFEAANGDTAAALIDGPDGFDLLLTDVSLPGQLDGTDLARLARTHDPLIPVVIATGYEVPLLQLSELRPPLVVIRKPYNPYKLAETVSDLLRADDAR
jgi:CheY-like chemotaxis protein